MDELQITERTINIEQVFRAKNPRLASMIPGLVFRYLRRIIHEREINDFLYRDREKKGLDFVRSALETFGVRVETTGRPVISETGRYIIASNHPLGGLDGMALMQVVGEMRKDVIFPVNDILMFLPNLKELFIPINKHGSNTENLQIIHNTFRSDAVILYFPAGLVSRKQRGVIRDLEWKKTFITKARQYRRDVIPVFIQGRNSNFFYRLANIRKRLRIKSNIEMLYLPDEMFAQKGKTVRMIFGEVIPYQVFDRRHSDHVWAGMLKDHIYRMGEGGPLGFIPGTETTHS
ncbi:MAG: 1-acyl-sn-glycerol-3-phosphate acyltransferase [Bacteroidales bacterium]|nr:1-acyl-sn-glycerol-3-phosphate acyltransferase [Bacteroidales bacterium]